jgi:hypothetical protein
VLSDSNSKYVKHFNLQPFQDRHTVGHVQPVIDQSQDWILLHGEENDFGTMLKIERAMVTCDGNDTDIVVRIFHI